MGLFVACSAWCGWPGYASLEIYCEQLFPGRPTWLAPWGPGFAATLSWQWRPGINNALARSNFESQFLHRLQSSPSSVWSCLGADFICTCVDRLLGNTILCFKACSSLGRWSCVRLSHCRCQQSHGSGGSCRGPDWWKVLSCSSPPVKQQAPIP